MASPRLTDEEIEAKFGRRRTDGVAFDQPSELGYMCPEGHMGDDITWSEFKEHIWCPRCNMDYHYAVDCKLRRMCWMDDEAWEAFLKRLPVKPEIVEGIQHLPDCVLPHKI